jgi:hypothetical protein
VRQLNNEVTKGRRVRFFSFSLVKAEDNETTNTTEFMFHTREEEMDFDALRKLMDDMEHEADEWLELVVTITADPKWALRGKYSYAVYNTYSNPYHKISWYRKGYDNYSRGF